MKKESKNLGVRRQCWNCPSIIARNINLTGTGYWISRCPKCLQDNEITIGGETHVTVAKPKTLLKAILLTAFILMALTPAILYVRFSNADKQEREVCGHYKTRADAQAAFNEGMKNPNTEKLFKGMDADHDGVACETNPLN